jgi:hypothetical protein
LAEFIRLRITRTNANTSKEIRGTTKHTQHPRCFSFVTDTDLRATCSTELRGRVIKE